MTDRAKNHAASAWRAMDSLSVDIADASSESIVIYDADGRIVHWNEASHQLYGFVDSEAIGKTATELFGKWIDEPEMAKVVSQRFWQSIVQRRTADGISLVVEIRLRSHRTETQGAEIVIEHGRRADPRIVEGHSIDPQRDWLAVWSIDVSVAASAFLTMAKSTHGGPSNLAVPDPRFVADYLRIKDLNFTAARLFASERDPAAVIGKSAYRYWPKNHRDALLDMTSALLSMGKSETPIVRRVVGADTLTVWRANTEHPSLVSVSVTGSWSDPETYWEMAASEQRYRNLIENIPLPVWQVDARVMSGVIENLKASGIDDIQDYLARQPDLVRFASQAVVVTEINESAIRLFRGKKREELLQDVSYLFAGTPAAASRVVMAHFGGGRNYSEEMKILTFEGELLEVLFYVTFPQYPEKLDKTLIMMIDVTEQRRIERQLRKIEADFAHAARVSALGELVTSIAHEVRQPLSVIVTDADTGIRWLGREEPNIRKVKSIIGRIMENAHRANEVIRRIKDMAVKAEPVRDLIDINQIVRESTLLVRSESNTHHISVTTTLARELPPIKGDSVQLQQVVVNLLINAIQAIIANGSRAREITVETSLAASEIVLVVTDSGGGIADDDLERVFDGFFTRKADGMGMGLTICRSIVVDHGGTISAENGATRGAVFRVTMPAIESQQEVAIETILPEIAGR